MILQYLYVCVCDSPVILQYAGRNYDSSELYTWEGYIHETVFTSMFSVL